MSPKNLIPMVEDLSNTEQRCAVGFVVFGVSTVFRRGRKIMAGNSWNRAGLAVCIFIILFNDLLQRRSTISQDTNEKQKPVNSSKKNLRKGY